MGKLYRVKRFEQGVTIIELLIGVALLALIFAIGVPSYRTMIQRKYTEGAAEKLFADLQFAKSEAIKRNVRVYVTFDIIHQCYGLDTASGCNCNTANSCELDTGVDKAVKISDFGETIIPAGGVTFPGNEVAFDPQRGTTTNIGTVTFQSPRGQQVNITIENKFHIRICSPAGGTKIFTYENC